MFRSGPNAPPAINDDDDLPLPPLSVVSQLPVVAQPQQVHRPRHEDQRDHLHGVAQPVAPGSARAQGTARSPGQEVGEGLGEELPFLGESEGGASARSTRTPSSRTDQIMEMGRPIERQDPNVSELK